MRNACYNKPVRPVALVSSIESINDDPDLTLIEQALSELDVAARAVAWDDSTTRWSDYSLAIVRSCWNYPTRPLDFMQWSRGMTDLYNPAAVIDWNIDKHYLNLLAASGLPTIPSVFDPTDGHALMSSDEWVVKPTVSASMKDTFRATSRNEAIDIVAALRRGGRGVMVQPYIDEIEEVGELALVYIDGIRSHAIRKPAALSPMGAELSFDAADESQYEEVSPPDVVWQLGDRAYAVVENLICAESSLLYARVDVIPRVRSTPLLMEVELIEPTLYFSIAP